ncbi:hypothetical protein EP7_001402 [Isosphaeraceae bacterium EP7]
MTTRQAGAALTLLGTLICNAEASDAGRETGGVTTVAVPGGGKPVVARVGPDGAIHLLFDSSHGPGYAKSTDGGLTFGPTIPVLGDGPRVSGLEYSAWDLAVGREGRIHVAMGTNAWKLKLPQDEWGLFYARLDPGSDAFTAVRNINRKPSEGFSLAADGAGNVTACWLSEKLYASVSRDDGETFAPPMEIDRRFNPCDCCTTSAAYGEDGRLAVLYREETANERDMYLVLWDQAGGRVERKRVGRTPWKIDGCPMTYYSVNARPGGFVAAWPTKGEIKYATLDGKGNPSGPAEIRTPGMSGMRTGVVALSGMKGGTLVAWTRDGRLGWQSYGADGEPSGPAGSAASVGSGVAGVPRADGGFVLFR